LGASSIQAGSLFISALADAPPGPVRQFLGEHSFRFGAFVARSSRLRSDAAMRQAQRQR